MASREVTVNGHHYEIWPGHVAQRLQRNGERRDCRLNPIGPQIMAKPPHQPGIVDLADRIFIELLRFLFFNICH